MNTNNILNICKHVLGVGTVSCIYASQVQHVYQFVGFSTISTAYLFALFSYYCILYGYDSELVSFTTKRANKLLSIFRIMIVSVGAILSILAFWIAPHSSERDIIYEVVNAFFCVFAVLFPELLLPLIFGIKNDQHQNLSADVKGEHTNY